MEAAGKQLTAAVWDNEAKGVQRLVHSHGMRAIIPDVIAMREKTKSIIPGLDGTAWRKGLYEEIQALK